MEILEQYFSPDGLLRLIVTRSDDGDISIGFDGFAWHTHGDILARLSGLLLPEAIRQYVRLIIGDDQIIALSRINGQIRDLWPTDDPVGDLRHKLPKETLEFRKFSGAEVQINFDQK